LSTLEAAALVLARLEDRPEIETTLNRTFARMLDRYRNVQAGHTPAKEPSSEVPS
jgi:hypothetical protein